MAKGVTMTRSCSCPIYSSYRLASLFHYEVRFGQEHQWISRHKGVVGEPVAEVNEQREVNEVTGSATTTASPQYSYSSLSYSR